MKVNQLNIFILALCCIYQDLIAWLYGIRGGLPPYVSYLFCHPKLSAVNMKKPNDTKPNIGINNVYKLGYLINPASL